MHGCPGQPYSSLLFATWLRTAVSAGLKLASALLMAASGQGELQSTLQLPMLGSSKPGSKWHNIVHE